MKRILLGFMILTTVLVLNILNVNATGAIVETPYVVISVNSQIIKPQNTPIIVDGRTLLPLRTLLNSFGIQNEDSYIYWNPTKRSVTINDSNTNVYLSIGNKIAYVNSIAVTLDVSPIIYKDRTYIPVRFISQSLDKEVNWDSSLTFVSIVDSDKFNKAKDILDVSDNLLKNASNLNYTVNVDVKIHSSEMSDEYLTSKILEYNIDFAKKVAYSKDTETSQNENNTYTNTNTIEEYVINGFKYTSTSLNKDFAKETFNLDDFIDTYTPLVNNNNALCYGLNEESDPNSEKLILQGSSLQQELGQSFVEGMNIGGASNRNVIDSIDTKVVIDKKTHNFDSVYTNINILHTENGIVIPVELSFSINFLGINNNSMISLPASLKTVQATSSKAGIWVSKTGAPTARAELAVAEVNGKIYALGGGYIGNKNSKLEEYDSITNSWTKKADFQGESSRVAAIGMNGKLYAVGGSYSKQLWEYDPTSDKWARKHDMKYERGYLAVATHNGKLYATGGLDGGEATMEVYDPSTDTWTEKKSMIVSRFAHNLVVLNDKMYAIGGYGGSSKTIEVYDFGNDSWSFLPESPFDIYSAGAVVLDNKIFIIGGANYSNRTVEYDPNNYQWIIKSNMKTGRERLGVAVVNKKIYSIAGAGTSSRVLNTVEEYTP